MIDQLVYPHNIKNKVNEIIDEVNIVRQVDKIADLQGLTGVEGQQVSVASYHGLDDLSGGGTFVWGTGRHNGGTFIDPNRAFPSDWSDPTQLEAWFEDSGSDVIGFRRVHVDEDIKVSEFGIRNDVGYDATKPFFKCIDTAQANHRGVDGTDFNILLTGNLTKSYAGNVRIKNVLITLGNDYSDQPEYNLTANKFELTNFTINGNRSARTLNEKWDEVTGAGGAFGKSIQPAQGLTLALTCTDFKADRLRASGVHSVAPYWINASGSETIGDLSFSDCSFTTYVSIGHCPKNYDKYNANECSQLPETYLVKYAGTSVYVQANRDTDDNFAQGAFGCRLLHGDVNINSFYALQYGTSALVSDGNNSFNANNITIVHNNPYTVSNNPAAPIFVELGKQVHMNNINIRIDSRSAREAGGALLYGYVAGTSDGLEDQQPYSVTFSNFNLRVAPGAKVEYALRGVCLGGGHLTFKDFEMFIDPASGVAIDTVLNIPSAIGGTVSLKDGTIEGGANINMHDCDLQHIESVYAPASNVNIGRQSAISNSVNLIDTTANVVSIIQPSGDLVIDGGMFDRINVTAIPTNKPKSLAMDGTKFKSSTGMCTLSGGSSGSCNISNILSESTAGIFVVNGWNTINMNGSTLKGNQNAPILQLTARYLASSDGNDFVRGLSDPELTVQQATATEPGGIARIGATSQLQYDWVTEDA